jgi:hypothetical protein
MLRSPTRWGSPAGCRSRCPWWWSTSWPARRRVADRADRGGLAGGAVPPRPRAGTPAAPLAGLRRRPGLGRRGAGTGRHLAADQHRDDPGADHLGRRAVPGPAPPGHRRRHPALPALNLDQISSRTVAYGLLTLLLAGGYAGIVLGLGRLLGRESSLVVAAATLAVVALFQPARGGFKRWSTGASTAAATTPPAPWRGSRPVSATSST